MEKNTEKKVKVIKVSKDEFIEMMTENEELTKSFAELMDTTLELKFTLSELMDVSIAVTSWMVNGDCMDQMGVSGMFKALELKERIDNIIDKELKKIGIEAD